MIPTDLLAQVDNAPLETLNLASITGVVAATMIVVEILKRVLSPFSWFAKIPVFVYAVIIAGILAFIANNIGTDDGSVLLEGSRWKLIWASIIAAAGASGFYTWLRNPESVKSAKKAVMILLPLGVMFFSGCASTCPEEAVLREGVKRVSRTMWEDHIDWAEKLTVDPATGRDHRDELPQLDADGLESIKTTKREFDGLVEGN